MRERSVPARRRDSNIELLRIITMLLIVAHHYVVNSGLTAATGPVYADPMSFRSQALLILGAWGKTGINVFVLISAYFMCGSKISLKKYLKLFSEVYFYRLLINAVFFISGYEKVTVKGLIKILLPVWSVRQNFTGCYLLFFLAIPFLNRLVTNLKEREHIRLIGLSALVYVFFGTLHQVSMNYVAWFCVLFFIGSYLRLYPKKCFENTKLWGMIALMMVVVTAASVTISSLVGLKLHRNMAYSFVSDSNTLLAVCTAIAVFLFFKSLRVPYSGFINTVAASTFGVLCIHANSDTMRRWLWRDTLDNVGAYASKYMILRSVLCVFGVFTVCTIIDMLRRRFIERPYLDFLDRRLPGIERRARAIGDGFCKKHGIGG